MAAHPTLDPDGHPPDTPSVDSDPTLAFLAEDPAAKRRLRLAVAVAVLAHCLLLAIPTLHSDAEPVEPEDERRMVELRPVRFKPPPPPPPEPQPEPQPQAREVPVPDPTPHDLEPIRPVEIPIEVIPVEPLLADWDLDLVVPEAPEVPEPEDTGPMLVGGDVSRPVGIATPEPRYTEPARRARIQGPVILQLTLDRGGEVQDVKVLRGLPMGLTESAVSTVQGWRYHPATLNGKPVPVYMNITVHFQLN